MHDVSLIDIFSSDCKRLYLHHSDIEIHWFFYKYVYQNKKDSWIYILTCDLWVKMYEIHMYINDSVVSVNSLWG